MAARLAGEVAELGVGQRRGSNDGGGLGCLDPDGIGRKRGRVGNEEEWGTGCRLGFGQGCIGSGGGLAGWPNGPACWVGWPGGPIPFFCLFSLLYFLSFIYFLFYFKSF